MVIFSTGMIVGNGLEELVCVVGIFLFDSFAKQVEMQLWCF